MWGNGERGSIALTHGSEQLTFGALIDRAKALARVLKRHSGVVALRARNDFHTAVTLVAALELGRPAALLPDTTEREMAAMRELLGRAVQVDHEGIVVWEAQEAPLLHHPDAALIAFTSGSTGSPRAVQLSRAHLERNTANVINMLRMEQLREQIIYAPLSHLFALLGHLLPGLSAGLQTHLYAGVADVRRLIASGETRGIIGGVPSHWEGLLRTTPADPKLYRHVAGVVVSGSAFGVDLRRRLLERFCNASVLNGYGLTEAPRILALPSEHPRFLSDATGLPTSGVDLEVTETGELRVRGDLVMLGYLGESKLTAERIRGGWLYTGDAARLDPDGVFTVLGRLDDLRKVGGERVSLVEVDQALLRLPGVADAAATTESDPVYGERLVAFLVSADGHEPPGRSALRDALATYLPWSKVPSAFRRTKELPRNRAGKIRRSDLLALPDLVEL